MTSFIIEEELTEDLNGVDPSKVIIAYEPIYSIGTGVIADINDVTKVVNLIREHLPNTKVLYGGSVNEDNALEISKIVDGFLIGGMGLHPEKVQSLINNLNN